MRPLQATIADGKVKLSGSFGVFFKGHLVAHFYDQHGASIGVVQVADVSPAEPVTLESQVTPPARPSRVSLHLDDESGLDRGALQEVRISTGDDH